MKKKLFISLIAAFSFLVVSAQDTDKAKATKLAKQAVQMMDKGQVDESIKLLADAKKLDPDDFTYDYETGYAYQLKEDYKKAILFFELTIKYKDATDQCYQMLGNSYDLDGQSKKAIEVYKEGLKKFPASGTLYMELGVVSMILEKHEDALNYWEKGIRVEPDYSSTYYKLANFYSLTTDRIWILFYGELFMLLESNSDRTKVMSKMLFDAYKGSIDITSDTSAKVDFTPPMVISSFDPKNFKLPFEQVYALDFLVGMSPSLLEGKKEIDIAYLHAARSGFIDWWYKQNRNKDYENILLDYQKKIKDAGHFESYNYWLMMAGNEKEFDDWYAKNEDKFKAFADWFNKNQLPVTSSHYFIRPGAK